MKKYIAIFSVISVVLLSMAAQTVLAGGGVPINDNLANATPVVVANGSGTVITSNLNATKQPGEPDHAQNAGGHSVWFKLQPTATSVYRISTFDPAFDTLLAVYTGETVEYLTPVVFNDDCHNNCGGVSTVDLMVIEGMTYWIAVDGYNDGAGNTGQGAFRLGILDNGVPFNDDLLGAYNLQNGHSGSIGGTNYNATRQVGEPDHVSPNHPGLKSVWYRWVPQGSFGIELELTEDFNSQVTIFRTSVQQPTFADLTRVGYNVDSFGDSTVTYRARFFAQSGFYYFIAVASPSGGTGNFQFTFRPAKMRYSMDTDAQDSKASIGIFRPSEGTWYQKASMETLGYNIFKWGTNGDVPIAADFTGDGVTDHTVVRNVNGVKYWYTSTAGATTTTQWGLSSDRPVVGDFDGDSRADLVAIRNAAQGFVWYVRLSSSGALRTFTFGTTGDRPILGDFNGDRFTDVAVVRSTQNGMVWYILYSASTSGGLPYTEWSGVQFGVTPDVPAVEDFDGDNKTDIAVFRPSTGTWYILQSSNGQVRIDAFGLSGDKPQPADYNGDGKADLCVFRPSNGTWYIARPTGVPGQNYDSIAWGIGTDIPVTSLSTLSQ